MADEKIEIKVPLEEWVHEIIASTMAEHQQQCPLFERVRKQEMRLAYLIGYMIGTGIVGGLAGGLLSRAMF